MAELNETLIATRGAQMFPTLTDAEQDTVIARVEQALA